MRNGALDDKTNFEDENNVTTNTDNESEPVFDSSDDDDFDSIISSDYDVRDDFMDTA